MFKKVGFRLIIGLSIMLLLLSACAGATKDASTEAAEDSKQTTETTNAEKTDTNLIEPHKDLNQPPVPLEMERDGTDVYVKMTSQITDIEIEPGNTYKAWTFNGEAPGPLIVVEEGDTLHIELDNMDPAVPHSIDLHAVHTNPAEGFADVEPNEKGAFSFPTSSPGVFMYHCATDPVLSHIANGMHGVIIVKPKDGFPTDDEVDQEYVVIQNEWYKYNDLDDMTNGVPSQVVFSTKALHKGQPNTNGTTTAVKDAPLEAKAGERIRLYVNNVGPNEVSSFHVIGSIMEDVYMDGNPANHMEGMQTVMLPASGGAVVEFTLKEPGEYPFVTHQFNHATKGAVGIIKVTE